MADGLPDPPALDPADLAGRSFGRTRKGKGFDPAEVRAALGVAADALRAWHERDERLQAQVRDLQDALASADEISDERLAALLGEETVRVIRTAQDAAAEIRRKADETALAARAEVELARTETEQLRREALHAAEAELEAARQRGRAMVAEAREVRERMLRDLAERRQVARQQIEAARAGRDRIVDALRSAGGAVEGLAGLLGELDDEIQQVSDRAAAEVSDDIGEVVAAVRAELDRSGATDGGVEVRTATAGVAVSDRDRTAAADADGPGPGDGGVEVVYDDVVVEFAPPASRAGADDGPADGDQVDDDPFDDLDDDDLYDDEDLDDDDLYDDEDLDDEDLDDAAGATGWSDVSHVEAAATAPVVPVHARDGAVTELAAARRTVGADAEVIDFPGSHRWPTGAVEHHEAGDEGAAHVDDVDPGAPADEPAASTDDTTPDDPVASIFERIRGAAEEPDAEPAPPDAEPDTTDPVAVDPDSVDPDTTAPDTTAPGAVEPDTTDPVTVGATIEDDHLRDRRDAALAVPLRSVGRTVKRLVTDEQNELLDQLRRGRRKDLPTVDDLVGREDEDLRRYADALTAELTDAAAAGASLWADAGGAVDRPVPDVDGVASIVVPLLAEALGHRRARLAATLEGAAADGAEPAELGDRLRATYRDWRTGTLDELVGDLVTAALAAGARTTAPDGAPCRWVPDHGGLPCADAEDNALAGCLALGTPFPTGDTSPPAHPGCRCLLVPATGDASVVPVDGPAT